MNTKFWLIISLLIGSNIIAQNISVGSIDMTETRLRNEQLLGRVDSLVSFSLRPLSQSLLLNNETHSNKNLKNKISFQALPIRLTQQYNTFAPSGWNDGAMIPAKGYQTLLSAGFYAKYGILNVQIKPEYVYATNPYFETFPLDETNIARSNHIYYLNYSDSPERFGDKAYSKLFWGQSRISVDYKSMSIGVSTENLWWGPGQRNSLIMSNNAPGFLHFTLNTRKPIKTFIGSFEGQLITGKLKSSGLDVSDEQYIIDGVNLEDRVNLKLPKEQDWRYLSGLTINYQPKWVPGLFIGLNRVFQIYHNDLDSSFSDYFPVITPLQKTKLKEEDAKARDQVFSLFFRWVFKESKMEIYSENGWNDHSQDLMDFIETPTHSRAFLIGFTKIFALNSNKDNYLKFNFENTQMQQSAERILFPAGTWYTHSLVRHGYTNQSQIMGAGIGPSGTSQTLDFSIWNKDKVWGFQFERYVHNLDFYYDTYPDYRHKWVDLSLNTYAYRKYGNFDIQAKLNTTWMANYQWQLNNTKLNLQFQLSLQYHL
nr:capsule assembly Wzi family protein [uncultured Flavobacterium sp.]